MPSLQSKYACSLVPSTDILITLPRGPDRYAKFVSIQIWALRSRLEKQPTDPAPAGRRHCYMRDDALVCQRAVPGAIVVDGVAGGAGVRL